MKTVLFDISPEIASSAVKHIKDENADSLMVMAPFSGKMSMHAPSKSGKHKGYHRIKCEIWIPEDAIQGEDALTDFGALALLRLPLTRVKDHMKTQPGAMTE